MKIPIPDGVREMFEESNEQMTTFSDKLDRVIELLTEIRDEARNANKRGVA